jgi:hypothetical protein
METDRGDMQTTLVVGASTDPARYAYVAAKMLASRKLDFIPIGIKKGVVFGMEIRDLKSKPPLEDIHTITLYIGPAHQSEWMDYLIGLKPKRIIFNPGTENPEFFKKAQSAGIEAVEACTLVLLSTGQF